MKEKLAVWALLAFLGGTGYLCYRGAERLSLRSEQTAGRWSRIHRQVACALLVEPAPSQPLPPRVAGIVRWRLPPFKNDEVAISGIEVDAPRFLRPVIESIDVRGFAGVAPPAVTVSLVFTPSTGDGAARGRWPLRVRGRAALTRLYWTRELAPAYAEAASLKSSGSPAEQERARLQLQQLTSASQAMAHAHPLVGESTIAVISVSDTGGWASKWLSVALRILAVLLLGAAFVIATLYVMTLKAGDVEP